MGTFNRDPLVMSFGFSISVLELLFTKTAFPYYVQQQKLECLTFQLMLLKEERVCFIHLSHRAFFTHFPHYQLIFVLIRDKGRLRMYILNSERGSEAICSLLDL